MREKLGLNQLWSNYQTLQHIQLVGRLITYFVIELVDRAGLHDASKLKEPEAEAFAAATPILASVAYGSEEYDAAKQKLGDALTHHYANNRHHPEHFANGIEGMNLVDLIEMVCDWRASTARNKNGDIYVSLEINAKRFGISPQLQQILKNTIDILPGSKKDV